MKINHGPECALAATRCERELIDINKHLVQVSIYIPWPWHKPVEQNNAILTCACGERCYCVSEQTGQYIQLENSTTMLFCHPKSKCVGESCTMHNRTDHPMRAFPQHFRWDRGVMERICPHGVGHPDPDEYMIHTGADDGTHGCDGCCRGAHDGY